MADYAFMTDAYLRTVTDDDLRDHLADLHHQLGVLARRQQLEERAAWLVENELRRRELERQS